MTQGTMPLRDNALSYFRSGYSSEELGVLWKETKKYMDSAFSDTNWSESDTNWSEIVSDLMRHPKPSDVQDFAKGTSNSADDSAEPAA